ncbi:MAG: glycosyltransferase family 87 protein [Chloroflexia bacterium]
MTPHQIGRRTLLLWGFYTVLLAICLSSWLPLITGGLASFQTVAWDFLNLYTGARLVLAGRGPLLYNLDEQMRLQTALITPRTVASGGLPFYYPPTILPFLLPFCLGSLRTGYFAWLVLNLLLVAGFLFLLQRHLRLQAPHGFTSILAVLSFYPLSIHLMQGQTALLVLLGLTLAYVLLQRGHDFRAGLVLALGSIKPPLLLPLSLVLLCKGRWRALTGLFTGTLLLLLPMVPVLGATGLQGYAQLVFASTALHGKYGIFPESMHNWWAFSFRLLGGGTAALLLCAGLTLASLGALLWAWHGRWQPAGTRFPLQYAATILLTPMLSPHLYLHDLVLWLLAAILIAYASPVLQEHRCRWLWYGLLLSGSAIPFWLILDPGPGGPLTLLPAVATTIALLVRLRRSQ